MSLIGIDFGNRFGVVAAAKKSGVDVLENERGHRQTPNMVWYPSGEAVSSSQKQRCVGERAATNFSRNAANTVTNVKRWLGVSSIKNAADEKEQSRLTCSIEDFGPADESRKQTVLFNVGGRKLCPEQVAATYLLHLKQIGEKNLQMPVQDVVLSVPGWWNQRQRQALLDSASIAGLNVKRLLNEHTAVALTYGIERTDLHPTKARKVLFVDMGHSCTTAQVVAFVKGKMTVLGVGFDPCLGGRDFDEAIADFVAKDIKEQYGIEVHGNPRLWQRVLTACEKQVKYPMGGGNPRASLTIDEIDDDTDYEVVIERELFNNLIDPLVEHISIPVLNAMKQAGIHFKDLSSVEIVGGGMRLLRCQEYLSQKILNGFKLSRTMNMEEGVAQGCAYMCAILSSRMDPFQVIDKSYYPISFKWMPLGDEEWQEETHVVFKRETSIPDETRFKFVCEKGIRLCAFYSNPSEIPCHCPGDDGWIGTYVVSFDESTKPSTPQKIHIHFALDGNGLFSVVGAEPCEPAKKESKKEFCGQQKDFGPVRRRD
jgi:heat shock protein 4